MADGLELPERVRTCFQLFSIEPESPPKKNARVAKSKCFEQPDYQSTPCLVSRTVVAVVIVGAIGNEHHTCQPLSVKFWAKISRPWRAKEVLGAADTDRSNGPNSANRALSCPSAPHSEL